MKSVIEFNKVKKDKSYPYLGIKKYFSEINKCESFFITFFISEDNGVCVYSKEPYYLGARVTIELDYEVFDGKLTLSN